MSQKVEIKISIEIDRLVYEKLCKVAKTLKVSPDRLATHLLQEADSKF